MSDKTRSGSAIPRRHTSGFEWTDLRYFLAVARAGRLTVAAQGLGVEHSTVSRRIAALECALGARLFDRRPTGYTLTPHGERLLSSAEAIETLALTAQSELMNADFRVSGSVRIGAPDGFGASFLAPRIGKLAAMHPDLEIQLVAMPRIFNPTKRETDIAIVLSRPHEGRLHACKLTDYELRLYAARSYLARHPRIRTRADLSGHRFIGYIEDLIYAPELDYADAIGRDAKIALQSSNLLAQYRATLAGAGICILPCFMAAPEAELEPVLESEICLKRTFWLAMHSDMRNLARIRLTADFITDEVAAARELFQPSGSPLPPC